MTFATNLRTVALNLLTNYGQSVSLQRVTEGSYNTSTSALATGTTTSYTGYGYPSPYNSTELANNDILSSDIKLLLFTTTLPLVGDVATIDTIVHRVLSVQRISAQGSDIIYKLQLRV
jgi:hypothetical protein